MSAAIKKQPTARDNTDRIIVHFNLRGALRAVTREGDASVGPIRMWAEAMQMNVRWSLSAGCTRYLSLAFWPSRQARNAAAACSRSSALLSLRRAFGVGPTSGALPLSRLLIRDQLKRPDITHLSKNVAHDRAATSTQRPWPIKLKLVHRVFWLCQSRMGIDPINRVLLGSKVPKMVHGPIRPHYLHAPNRAVLHWR